MAPRRARGQAHLFCVVGGLMIVAILGSSLPALRAARLEPLIALRHE